MYMEWSTLIYYLNFLLWSIGAQISKSELRRRIY